MTITQRFATENYVNTKVASKADVVTLDNYYLKSEANTLHTEILEYVDDEVAALVNSAPETLDTLGELAIAFEENKDMVETLNAAVTNKAEKSDLKDIQESINTNTNSINSIQTQVNGILELLYPKGAIYISTVATNPSVLFGFGVWEQIEDVFLLGAGSAYTAGSTGGESTHTLTVQEMPVHSHTVNAHSHAIGLDNDTTIGTYGWSLHINQNGNSVTGAQKTVTSGTSSPNTNTIGGGVAHNNMPPYLTVYMWKRIG